MPRTARLFQECFNLAVLRDIIMCSIPLACDSLDVSGFFVDALYHYTDQAAQLKTLKVESELDPIKVTTEDKFWHCFHSFKHLTQLKTLEIACDGTNLSLAECLQNSPQSLESLTLRHSESDFEVPLSSSVPYHLSSGFSLLRKHDLSSSFITLPVDSIICLDHLTFLSLGNCFITADCQPCLTKLTNLVVLDLSVSTWAPADAHPGDDDVDVDLDAFVIFCGWPALTFLGIRDCTLFSASTVLTVPRATELHLTCLPSELVCDDIHLGVSCSLQDVLLYTKDYIWFKYIVGLQFHVGYTPWTAADFKLSFMHVVQSCPCLQQLCMSVWSGPAGSEVVNLVLDEGQGSQLTHIGLIACGDLGLRCKVVDFCSARSLTSVTLAGID